VPLLSPHPVDRYRASLDQPLRGRARPDLLEAADELVEPVSGSVRWDDDFESGRQRFTSAT
jgi:hypothetical protein